MSDSLHGGIDFTKQAIITCKKSQIWIKFPNRNLSFYICSYQKSNIIDSQGFGIAFAYVLNGFEKVTREREIWTLQQ